MSHQFQRSYETQIIVDFLSKMEIGGLATYQSISQALRIDVLSSYYAFLSARKIVEKNLNFVFSIDRGVGIRRLSDPEIIQKTHSDRDKIKKITKNATSSLMRIQNFQNLSDAEKSIHQAHMVIYAIISQSTKSTSVEQFETLKPPDNAKLLGNILDAVKISR